ncbi:MAG: hypothetical protein IT457_24180 [Planctomycetes bacterium]|nr:hypothetical protein [Planctomycetota bacterium]
MIRRRPSPLALAIAVLVLAPAVLLNQALLFGASYFPWDPARFPPAALMLDEAQLAVATAAPSNLDVTEIPGLVVPELELAREELAAGRFPSWNPYARFGAPLFANGLAAMANPLNAITLLAFDPRDGLAWRTWFALAAAGILALFWFRRLGLAVAPACLAALVFQLGGTLAANAPFYMRLDPLVALPGALLAGRALAEARGRARLGPAAGLALALAFALLAGFPPFAVAVGLLLGWETLTQLVASARQDGARGMFRLAAWLLGAGLLGVALAAIQLAPMFAFFPESNRELAPKVDAILGQGRDLPLAALGLVLPDAIGWPGETPAAGASSLVHLLWSRSNAAGSLQYPSNWGFTEYAMHPGALALVLALLGVMTLRTRALRVTAAALPLLALLAIAPRVLAPLYQLPVVASVQPMRLFAPAALIVALLAGCGLQAALSGEARRRTLVAAGLAALCAAGCLALRAAAPLADHDAVIDAIWQRFQGPDRPQFPRADVAALFPPFALERSHARLEASVGRGALHYAIAALVLLAWRFAPRARAVRPLLLALTLLVAALELLALAAPLNPCRELQRDPLDTPVHEFLVEAARTHAAQGGIVVARAAPQAEDPLTLPPLLFPLRLRDLNSYAFVDGRSYRPFLELYGEGQMIRRYWPRSFPDDARLQRPFFDLIGLRYVASSRPLAHAGPRVGPTAIGPRGAPFWLHERTTALPRAFVVHGRRELPDDAAIASALVAQDLAPRDAVLVDPSAAAALREAPLEAAPANPRGVRFELDRPDRIELAVEAGPAGYLVLADAPLRGWTAHVDGQATPIVRGNLFMRVVPVHAGAARVVFTYSAPGLAVGAALSGAALVLLVVLLACAAQARRHRPST